MPWCSAGGWAGCSGSVAPGSTLSSGRVHLAAGLGAGLGAAYLTGDLAGAELAGLAVAYGLAPDVDTSASLIGGFVPQWLAPEVPMVGGHGRRWFGVLTIPHHGPTHSLVTGLFLALPLGLIGWKFAFAAYAGWAIHLLLDPRSQLLWPISRR